MRTTRVEGAIRLLCVFDMFRVDNDSQPRVIVFFTLLVLHRIFDRIPRITLDTVFLDEDLRVSRLPDRNFLIYVKDY